MSKRKKAKPAAGKRPTPPPAPASSMASVSAHPQRWNALLAVAEPLSVALLFIYLLSRSWLRWMDPLIDFPRDLYYAWRLSEGDLLYRQLANWYGPLAQLAQGAAFRLFGVGIDTMAWTNIALTAAVVILLRDIFRVLGNRLSGWLAAIVFVGVFAFGNYINIGNYNFLAPYVAQSTYSFAGLAVVLWGLVHHLKVERPRWLAVAGLGLAVAYLDKPEALLAALGSLGIYFAARMIRAARMQPPAVDWRGAGRWLGPATGWLAGGFFSLWAPVFLYFMIRGGLRYAMVATNFVPYSVLASRFRHTLMTAHVQQGFFGFDQPWTHLATQSLAGVTLVVVCGVMAMAARAWARAPKFSAGWWGWPAVVAAAGGTGAWLAEDQAKQWLEIGAAVVFPVILTAVVMAMWSLRAAWTGRAGWTRPLGLAVVGVAAALMLARMILFGRVYHFGFFMMPLAVLWLVHLMVVEAARPAPGGRRANVVLPVVFAALVLTGVVALAKASLYHYAKKNYEVGEGRDHFYSFGPEVMNNGLMVKAMESAFQERTPKARTLVVFPEGIMVIYLLRVPTTLAELEFQPVALAYAGPAHVLDELKAHPPESIIFYDQDFSEFGVAYFGADDTSGRNLVLWINDHYWLAGMAGHTEKTVSRHELDLLEPGTPGGRRQPFLQDANGIPTAPSSSP
jgi:hypothetical protein